MTTNQAELLLYFSIIICGLPLLFLVHSKWASSAVFAYVLTACIFGVVLIGEYPPFGSIWFWKAVPLIITVHATIVAGLIYLDMKVPAINRGPRGGYGILLVTFVAESKLFHGIIDKLGPQAK